MKGNHEGSVEISVGACASEMFLRHMKDKRKNRYCDKAGFSRRRTRKTRWEKQMGDFKSKQ